MKLIKVTAEEIEKRRCKAYKYLLPMITIFMLSGIWSAKAQAIRHHSYTTYYDSTLREPDSVSWDLTPQMVSCEAQARKDRFAADPDIPDSAKPSDYANSGYDKGHLFSYDDAMCNDTDKVECFYMSNMLPQIHPFNAGDWKVVEMEERIWAKDQKLHIVAGGLGSLGHLKNGENIPEFMWKVIYFSDGRVLYWIMPNDKSSHGHAIDTWEKSRDDFNKITGYSF